MSSNRYLHVRLQYAYANNRTMLSVFCYSFHPSILINTKESEKNKNLQWTIHCTALRVQISAIYSWAQSREQIIAYINLALADARNFDKFLSFVLGIALLFLLYYINNK